MVSACAEAASGDLVCRACERTFNALTGTPLAGLRLREKWLDYARALVDGVSLRKAAARTDIHLETSFRWRHHVLAAGKDKKAAAVTGIVEADETFILKSAKGSRNLVGRAPMAVGRVETNVNVTPVANSIRQLAIMTGNVQALSVAVVVGSENLNATSGNANGSVGGGLTISSVGAANSVSTITTAIPATIAPK